MPNRLNQLGDGLLANPLFQIGQGILANSGPSFRPVNPWRGVNQGLLASAQARAYREEQLRKQMEMQQAQAFMQAQMDNYLHGQGIAERKQSLDERAQDLAEENFNAGVGGSEDPSAVREFEYWLSLSPEDRQAYLRLKRAQQWLDIGNRRVLPNPTDPGGAPLAEIPIGISPDAEPNLRQAQAEASAYGQERGKSRGEAEQTVQAQFDSMDDLETQIEQFRKAPGFSDLYGKVDQYRPDLFMSSDALDAEARRKKLISTLSLAARAQLKGQGEITKDEQQMLREAQTTLEDRSISDKAALEAVDLLLEQLQKRRERLKTKASDWQIEYLED